MNEKVTAGRLKTLGRMASEIKSSAPSSAPVHLGTAAVIHAAFDIGSSQHKLLVAEVEQGDNGVLVMGNVLFSEQAQVRLNQAFLSSGGVNLPDNILRESRAALTRLKAQGIRAGATAFAGIATAVFRRAGNGAEYLRQVAGELGLDLRVVSQHTEGEIGFLTASALSRDVPRTSLVSWDSGGGSFQIGGLVDGQVRIHQGPIGDADMMKMAAGLQSRKFVSGMSVNPVSVDTAMTLAENAGRLVAVTKAGDSQWLCNAAQRAGCSVVGFGFHTSVFRVCFDATGKWKFNQQDVRDAIESCCGRSDEELDRLLGQSSLVPQEGGYPEVEMVVPKLVLVLSVMQAIDMKSVTYREANGSCAGIILSQTMWE